MPRPQTNLEPFKARIIALYQADSSSDQICTILENEYQTKVRPRTISSRLQAWGIHKYHPRTRSNNPQCLERVKILFQNGLQDKDILQVLQNENLQISARTLRRLRSLISLPRRTDNPDHQQEQEEGARQIIIQELGKGVIKGYGRELLFRYIRQLRNITP